MIYNYKSIQECIPEWVSDSSSVLAMLVSNSGNVIYSNQAFIHALQLGKNNIVGMDFNSIFHNSLNTTFQDIRSYCDQIEDGLRAMDLESATEANDWAMRSTWEFRKIIIIDTPAILGIGKRVEDYKLDQSDNYDSKISRAVTDHALVSVTDARGLITMVNDNFCNYTRFSRYELIGHRHQEIFKDLHSKNFWKEMIDTLRRGQPWINEVNLKSKYDEVFWFHTFINPVFDDAGQLIQLLHIQFDITAHKRMAEEKIEQFNRYNKITANLPGFVYQYLVKPDQSHYFPFVTQGVSQLYGLPAEILRIDASPAFSKVHPDDLEELKRSIRMSAEQLSNWNHTFRIQRSRSEVLWVQGIATPEQLEDGSVLWHGFNYDITERKMFDERLQKHKQRLDEIAFIQAHEFRRPVANMLGIFDILVLEKRKKRMQPEQIEHWLNLMYESVKQTDEIIGKIVTKVEEEGLMKIE